MANEMRFGVLRNIAPERADALLSQAQDQVRRHYAFYEKLAAPAATPPPPATPS
jgi:pyruvate-ferredoxin/flavodoxin oxidoreductase